MTYVTLWFGAVVITISVGEGHTQVALTRAAADALGLALLKMGFDGAAFGGPPRAAAHRDAEGLQNGPDYADE